ncbi:MAG: DinB family protein [Anaerolineales bacterium]|nr:DinB family protein [Anaerolineales bacterium]
MLDFTPVHKEEISYAELVEGLTADDLRALTNEMIDRQLELIADCSDADVIFEPQDPEADDPFAIDPEEKEMPWTLGHLIVHVTASSEEAAFLAAELARGVPYEQRRSRFEVHWTTIKSIGQCRHRLEESRRMRLTSLEIWPDEPHLENTFTSEYTGYTYDAIARFVFGLGHDDAHLAQIADVVQQAKALE